MGILSSLFSSFGPTHYVAPDTATAPTPVANPGAVSPDENLKKGLQTAYTLYPEVPKGLVEAVMMQESGMGTNTKNAKLDAGQYGYIGGITKTGIYSDMLKNKNINYAAKQVPGAMDLSTSHGAIAMIASILAQKIRQHYNGQISPEQVFDLYDKHYKTNVGAKLSVEQKKKFIDYFNYYAKQ